MDGAAGRPNGVVLGLLAVRFLLELALWSSFTVSCVRLLEGPAGWLAGLSLSALVIVIWAMLLSPRRRVGLPVAVRVAIELALFLVAGALLTASGLTWAGAGLIALELLDLGLLRGPDAHAM